MQKLVPTLQNGNIQPHTGVPCDVTVVAPRTGIVHLKLDDKVPVPALHMCISSCGIVRIDDGGAVPFTGAFSEDLLR